jgi:hypothetical protein
VWDGSSQSFTNHITTQRDYETSNSKISISNLIEITPPEEEHPRVCIISEPSAEESTSPYSQQQIQLFSVVEKNGNYPSVNLAVEREVRLPGRKAISHQDFQDLLSTRTMDELGEALSRSIELTDTSTDTIHTGVIDYLRERDVFLEERHKQEKMIEAQAEEDMFKVIANKLDTICQHIDRFGERPSNFYN